MARSLIGVMVDSMDRPHGDQVDRTAAATATAEHARGMQRFMGSSRVGPRGGPLLFPAGLVGVSIRPTPLGR